jgi:glycosyltransferase involved in cell wall biosynthesis
MSDESRIARYRRRVTDRGVRILRNGKSHPGINRALRIRKFHRTVYWTMWEARQVLLQRCKNGTPPTASVAVVIPTFRRPDLLREAVSSVLAQTYKDFVVIIVDDGGGQVRDLPDDDRIHVVRLTRNTKVLGVVNNIGIRLTNSRYIALLNDDNTWRAEHLRLAVAALDRGAGIVYTGMRRHRRDDSDVDELAVPFSRDRMKTEFFTDSSTLVFRRVNAVHFERTPRGKSDPVKEDWEFVWRYSRHLRTELMPSITVDYLIHDESYLTDWNAFWREQGEGAE